MLAGEADLTISIGAIAPQQQQATTYWASAHPIKDYVRVDDSVSIYYEVHGLPPGGSLEQAQHLPKVVMIMGLACGCSAWQWQLQDLVQQHQLTPDYTAPNSRNPSAHGGHPADSPHQIHQQQQLCAWSAGEQGSLKQRQWQQEQLQQLQQGLARQQMLVCVMDNRGMGRSSCPQDSAAYSTSIMARDVLAVMDQLRWDKAHVLGFSMGGMIAQRLAVAAPSRIASLTLLSTSAGGWQIVPTHSWSGLKTALRMMTARSAEDAADATLRFHFRRRTLKAYLPQWAARRQDLLRREYLTAAGTPLQPPHGFKGQAAACWRHSLSTKEAAGIAAAGFSVLVVHGRSDKLASPANAEALARRLQAPCVLLPGAHFIVRECAGQINMLLSNLVWGRQHIMAADNTPYLDPSPSILKAWKQLDAQSCACGVPAAAAAGEGAAGQQAGALAVACAAAAAAGPASANRKRKPEPASSTQQQLVDTITRPDDTDANNSQAAAQPQLPQEFSNSAEGSSSSSSSSSSSGSSFCWLEHWYPVHVEAMADPARPHAVTLLGKQLVLWRDGQGQWQCMQDACPHRLAPLSEGRIEADGTLQCSYHGWRFDSSGRCTDIPQALDAKAKAVACASSRSCVTAYPTRQQYGLIWVWPSAGPAAAAQAAAAHLPVSQKLQEAWAAGNSPTWYRRVLPYSWDILVENLSDPSHLPFSHHRLFPGLTRAAGGPMPFSAVAIPAGDSPEARAARPQYAMAHQPPLAAFEYPAGFTAGGVVAYTPPCAVVYEGKGSFVQTELLAVPSGPGQALVFTAGVSSAAKVQGGDVLKALLTNPKQVPMLLMRMKMERAPTYQSHLRSNKLFDQDGAFLHMQDVELARRGRGSWAKEYYSPVSCDSAIIAGGLRVWQEAGAGLMLLCSSR
ncbi:hypothetical protein OEZ86_003772 [Tetradesmus obliquus]|nr:hypothetical protein OEZ86_003772 [Tetradesmus obliquus]